MAPALRLANVIRPLVSAISSPVLHRAQGEIHELGAIQQARIQVAQNPRLPL
jgi:hypothetical protein